MPHVSSSGGSGGGDDLGSTDEVKVFKDEGDGEDEKRSSENLTEEKSSLIDLTESEEKSGGNYATSKNPTRTDHSPVFGKVEPGPHTSSFNMGYLVSPYGYANGAAGPIPVSMAGKMGLAPTGHPGAALPFFCHNGDPLSQPPPAHMGIPPYQLDGKTGSMGEYVGRGSPLSPADWRRLGPLLAATGLTRPPMYPFSPGQYPYPMLSPEMSQVAASWHTPTMYPLSPGAGFRSPYPSALPISTSSLPSDFYRFSPTGLIPTPTPHHHHHHPGLSPHGTTHHHTAIVTPGPKQELPELNHNRYSRNQSDQKNNDNNKTNQQEANNANDKKKPHIKKPLNAFMLYMKEMRAKVVAECTLKESAAINQILGRKWHSLSREEQAKYYEKARQERQLHMQLYPGWSARDNYGYGTKKKKRKKERTPVESGGNSMKKCRARYGLEQQSQWCKPCRRKKKCIRYMEPGGDNNNGMGGGGGIGGGQGGPNQSDDDDDDVDDDDNLGSCGSTTGDAAHTPPEDTEDTDSINNRSTMSSSPGGLSGLSSLTSPGGGAGSGGGLILPSPSTSVASPSVSVASPYMLQSPLTPHDASATAAFDSKLPPIQPPPPPPPPPSSTAATASAPTSNHLHLTNNNNNNLAPSLLPPAHHHHHSNHHPQQQQQHQHHHQLHHHQLHHHHHHHPLPRNPVGTNPHDINNPLSVNQLTGQCVVKNEPPDGNGGKEAATRSIISVT